MSTVGQAFDGALSALRVRYLGKLEEAVAELSKLIAFCEMESLTPDVADAAKAMAHKLTGSGQTLGFAGVSANAGSLEQALEKNDASLIARTANALLKTCRDAIKAGAGEPPPMAATAPELPPLVGPSIVAIHDNPITGRLLTDVFASYAEIVTYKSVAEVAPAAGYAPKLVVVDLDSEGAEPATLGHLRMKPGFADVPVLALTAQRRSAAVARAVGGAHLEALIKPVTPIELDSKAHAAMRRGRLSVVIGDDDRIVRELLKARFEANRFQVFLANDGEEVMTMARAHVPSLIILDREMPKIEGLKVLSMLKAEPATHGIPVIMLTSKGRLEEIAEGKRGGAADYIVKPFAPDHLMARASEILGVSG
ncbi:MAG TPA: response regulator [Rhizomicrobium sp.]